MCSCVMTGSESTMKYSEGYAPRSILYSEYKLFKYRLQIMCRLGYTRKLLYYTCSVLVAIRKASRIKGIGKGGQYTM